MRRFCRGSIMSSALSICRKTSNRRTTESTSPFRPASWTNWSGRSRLQRRERAVRRVLQFLMVPLHVVMHKYVLSAHPGPNNGVIVWTTSKVARRKWLQHVGILYSFRVFSHVLQQNGLSLDESRL